MSSGGARTGAGRPKDSGKYGESTAVIRVPESLKKTVQNFVENRAYHLPLYSHSVSAGFPSPADDHVDSTLSLDEHLMPHPAATFLVRAKGDSMVGAGIESGDLLVVDKSLPPQSGDVVIAVVEGELTVKRLKKQGRQVLLVPENDNYPPIPIQNSDDFLWGVVTYVIHATRKCP